MDLLIVPVPVFNEDIAVEGYYFRHRKGNDILESSRGTSLLDGAMNSPALEMLNSVSLDALTMGKPVFVPITKYMLLSDLERQTEQPAEKIIFLMDGDINLDEPYIENINRLKNMGYRFAIKKIVDTAVYAPVLELCDYIFYDHRIFEQPEQVKLRITIKTQFKHLKCVYTHIDTMEMFKDVKARYEGCFEGRFYRMPVTKGDHDVSPLQVNLINLLNQVQDENFEFDDVAEIIQKDPSLTVALLRLVNSAYMGLTSKIKTIGQAVVMLGQDEVRKWITTAVAKTLGQDKPDEITRLSLVRAKFAESLAPFFGLEKEKESIFLMGLFSVLDAILDMPMEIALEKVHVSDEIRDALINSTGPYYELYFFLTEYEAAIWNFVSRMMIINDMTTEDVYSAYIDAVSWYGELLNETN